MKPIYLIKSKLLFIFCFLMLASCNKNDFDFDKIKTDNLETEWGVPLVSSKLTLEDFLKDTIGTIHTEQDGAVTLIYKSTNLVSKEAEERTKIKDQLKNLEQVFPVPDTISGIPVVIPLTFFFTFDLTDPGQRIDSMEFKGGTYKMTLRTNLNKDDAQIHLEVPNFIHQTTGEMLDCDFDLSNPQQYNEVTKEITFDLSDYYVQFYSNPDTTFNIVYIYATVTAVTDENPNLLSYFVSLENKLTNMTYSFFTGYIGYHTESYTDTIDLGIYSSADFGSILFGPESVKLKIHAENELGFPIKINAEQFTAYHTQGNSNESVDVFLFDSIPPNTFNIEAPTYEQIGQTIVTDIVSDESNIVDALNIAPNKIALKLVGIFNPDANPGIQNFFYNTSKIKIDVALELELFGKIEAFRIADTLDFSLTSDEHLNGIEFNAIINNGFPIAGKAQVLFTDENFNILYSLFPEDESIIVSGETGAPPDYKVISPSKKETIIVIDSDDIEVILGATQLIFTTTLSTEPGKMVKIYSDYSVDLTLSAKLYVNY
jgi:hypothetical protein